jgi:hypothetical protein
MAGLLFLAKTGRAGRAFAADVEAGTTREPEIHGALSDF